MSNSEIKSQNESLTTRKHKRKKGRQTDIIVRVCKDVVVLGHEDVNSVHSVVNYKWDPRFYTPIQGCLGVAWGQHSWVAHRFSRGPRQRTEYTGTPARSTSSLWIPSWCWLALHKPPGNGCTSWPRQNSRRVTMWRQRNQHLSLAHPQALTTCLSVHSGKVGECPVMKLFGAVKMTRCLCLCYCTTANLKFTSTAFLAAAQ